MFALPSGRYLYSTFIICCKRLVISYILKPHKSTGRAGSSSPIKIASTLLTCVIAIGRFDWQKVLRPRKSSFEIDNMQQKTSGRVSDNKSGNIMFSRFATASTGK